MIKYFCDCCGKECKPLHQFEYLCHVADLSVFGHSFYEQDDNAISGIKKSEYVCISCYNEIMTTAFNKFREIRKKSNVNQ